MTRVANLARAPFCGLLAILSAIYLTAKVPTAHEEHRLTGLTHKLKQRGFFLHPKRMKDNSTNKPTGLSWPGWVFHLTSAEGPGLPGKSFAWTLLFFFRRLTGLRRLRGLSEFLANSASLANFGQISALLRGRLQDQQA